MGVLAKFIHEPSVPKIYVVVSEFFFLLYTVLFAAVELTATEKA